jgi:hypothetical protein
MGAFGKTNGRVNPLISNTSAVAPVVLFPAICEVFSEPDWETSVIEYQPGSRTLLVELELTIEYTPGSQCHVMR